jgi:transposase
MSDTMDMTVFPVGIDWGDSFHQVCLVDSKGETAMQRRILHTTAGICELIDLLHRISPEDHGKVHVGMETKEGTVVDVLLTNGFLVFSCNPVQTKQFRGRYGPSGAKDDRRDAFVLANAIRTDEHCFRKVVAENPEVLLLREVSRDLEQGKTDLRAITNRLREHMHRYYLPLIALCNAADEPWLWELLELAPTPEKGRRIHLNTLTKLLRHHRIRRFSAAELHSILRQDPLPIAPGVVAACVEGVALLVARAHLLHDQLRALEHRQDELLALMESPSHEPPSPPMGTGAEIVSASHEQQSSQCSDMPTNELDPSPPTDAAILRSFPGVGRVVSATLLSEASSLIRARDLAGLRGLTGIAAVTVQSGHKRTVRMRRACNARLRNAMYYWASTCIQADKHMRSVYDRIRTSGKPYAQALRSVADHLLRVLVGALLSRTLYDHDRWPEYRVEPNTATA